MTLGRLQRELEIYETKAMERNECSLVKIWRVCMKLY